MARASRLLDLIQELRGHRRPVSAQTLAAALGVSMRTVYRDVATLIGSGAPIEGEAGVGYVLRPGFFLPPLMLRDEEIEAVALGLRWVGARGDESLAAAARDALAKITAVLPEDLRETVEAEALFAVPEPEPPSPVDLAILRRAIRAEHKLRIAYVDGAGVASERTVWPLALTLFDGYRLIPAWCELRDGFRIFRTDRITTAEDTGERLPRRRRALLKQWRVHDGLPERDD